MATLPRALTPFRTIQYRILAVALTMSLFGSGVWVVALAWQVISLGGSPLDLSFIATGAAIGLIIAVLFGGVAADRLPQKGILVTVECCRIVVTATVAVLALNGWLEVWHLAIAATLLGVADGFFYPAYSALLPSVLAPGDLLAANGLEGVLRPAVQEAGGPALGSIAIAIFSPAIAFVAVSVAQVIGVCVLVFLQKTPVRRDLEAEPRHPVKSLFTDLGGGFAYMFRTPWLLGTLLFACALVLVIMGPIEVLLPFAVKNQVPLGVQAIFGGGAGAFAVALAAFGIGGAVGSIVVASRPLPRRYLTVMNLLWGIGCIPLALVGFTDQLWLIVIALAICGFAFSAATVIWGTLLQRRVPASLLGRVSSLDFFVSLALMPISMAVAGPVGVGIGIPFAFVIAGVVPVVLAVIAVIVARMPRDEIDNPLDLVPDDPADAEGASRAIH